MSSTSMNASANADEFNEFVRFSRKVPASAADGQPITTLEELFGCLCSVRREPITESISGGIVRCGVRYTIRTWRCPETERLGIDCVAQLRDGTAELDYVIADGAVVEVGGAQRASV